MSTIIKPRISKLLLEVVPAQTDLKYKLKASCGLAGITNLRKKGLKTIPRSISNEFRRCTSVFCQIKFSLNAQLSSPKNGISSRFSILILAGRDQHLWIRRQRI
jgi:hypothetical protein